MNISQTSDVEPETLLLLWWWWYAGFSPKPSEVLNYPLITSWAAPLRCCSRSFGNLPITFPSHCCPFSIFCWQMFAAKWNILHEMVKKKTLKKVVWTSKMWLMSSSKWWVTLWGLRMIPSDFAVGVLPALPICPNFKPLCHSLSISLILSPSFYHLLCQYGSRVLVSHITHHSHVESVP